mgnify:CR=1 FL=1
MQIVRDLAGYSLGRSDLMRRAMAKKKRDVMAKEREYFIDGMTDEAGNVVIDGAVRRGKTLCLGLSFFCWAMCSFQDRNFALCGRTIRSVRRNLLSELLPILEQLSDWAEKQM